MEKSSRSTVFILMVHLTSQVCFADTIIMSELKSVLQNAPKVWFKYVQYNFGKNLNLSLHIGNCLTNILNYISSESKLSKNITCSVPHVQYLMSHIQYLKYQKRKQITGLATIKDILGHFITDIPRGIPFMLYGTQVDYTLQFNLHENLRLNITFFKLEFPKTTLDCHVEYVQVKHSRVFAAEFCGHYPLFSFYSTYEKVDLHTAILLLTRNLYVEGTFAVIDKDITYNIKQIKYWPLAPKIVYRLVYAYQYIVIYFIKVRKHCKIVFLKTNALLDHIVIYDGPSFISNTLEKGNYTFGTSTFQCIVELIACKQNVRLIAPIVYAESPLLANNIYLIGNLTHSVHLPDKTCQTKVCVLHVISEFEYHVNVTVLQIVTKTNHNPKCTYCGAAFVDQPNGTYVEKGIMCKSEIRSYYSISSSMNIVLFWYKELNEIHLSFQLSQTKCKIVLIDPCLFNKECKEEESFRCRSHLEEITKLSKTIISLRQSNVYFTLEKSQCIILKMFNSYKLPDDYYKYRDGILKWCNVGVFAKLGNHVNMVRYLANRGQLPINYIVFEYIKEVFKEDGKLPYSEDSPTIMTRTVKIHKSTEVQLFTKMYSKYLWNYILFKFKGNHQNWVEIVITKSDIRDSNIVQRIVPIVHYVSVRSELDQGSIFSSVLSLQINTPISKYTTLMNTILYIGGVGLIIPTQKSKFFYL